MNPTRERSEIHQADQALAQVPRGWEEVRAEPRDQRALLAMVAAFSLMAERVEHDLWQWVMAARKAGAAWEQLAGAAIYDDGEVLRVAMQELLDNYDVGGELRAELVPLLAPDPAAPDAHS